MEAAKKEADKELAAARQQVEDIKEEVQRELAAAQNATAEAAKKGYHDAASTYTLVIRFVIFYCVIFGLTEVIKHRYIFDVYIDLCTFLIIHIGFVPALTVTAAAVGIFVVVYFAPWGDCDDKEEYYLGLSIRLMLLIWLYTMADAVADTTAAIIIYLSCIIVGIVRWKFHKA